MTLPFTENALEVCRQHLDCVGARNTEVESFLTRYLLVLIYAEFENRVRECLSQRADGVSDDGLKEFVKFASRRICKGLKISDLKSLLGHFGKEHKEMFAAEIENTKAHTAYDLILAGRHNTAHNLGGDAPMTFSELEENFKKSLSVMIAFRNALNSEVERDKTR